MSRRSPFGELPQVPLALKQNEALDPVDVSSLGADGIMLASDDVSHLIEQFGVCPPAAFSLRCPTCPRFCPSKPQTQAGLGLCPYREWLTYCLFSHSFWFLCAGGISPARHHIQSKVFTTSTMGISLRRLSCGTVTSVTGSGQMPVFGVDISRSRARILSMTLL